MKTTDLKFRAYHKGRNEMYDVHSFTDKHVFKRTLDGIGNDGNPDDADDVELLMYTATTDMEGNLIADGDILFCPDRVKNCYMHVHYDSHGGCFAAGGYGTSEILSYFCTRNRVKIVGYIYEHKHLLQ